jgi:hypothetical protein
MNSRLRFKEKELCGPFSRFGVEGLEKRGMAEERGCVWLRFRSIPEKVMGQDSGTAQF